MRLHDDGLYRRHTSACSEHHKPNDRSSKDCKCIIQIECKIGDQFVRASTKTRSWDKARKMLKAAKERGTWEEPAVEEVVEHKPGKSIKEATAEYIQHVSSHKGRNISDGTASRYRTLLGRLDTFCDERGYTVLTELDFAALNSFKGTWPLHSIDGVRNTIGQLRSFYEYAVKSAWCNRNVANDLEMPMGSTVERLPFTPDEERSFFSALATYQFNSRQVFTNDEVATFCYLMRYAGMAIVDACLFQQSELKGDEVRYYRKKMRRVPRPVHVIVPIPGWLAERLNKMTPYKGKYFFCRGEDRIETVSHTWHRRLRYIFNAAGIENGSAHRFRHTFATTLLESGESVEDVARWLGHSSIKTTERYYSHWIESRVKTTSAKLRQRYVSVAEPSAAYTPGAPQTQEYNSLCSHA